jgi:hypothetical protein
VPTPTHLDRFAQFARTLDHLFGEVGQEFPKLINAGLLAPAIKRPLSRAQYGASSERFEAGRA